MKRSEIIATLNELIEMCNDSAGGFLVCADNAQINSPQLKMWLVERSHECVLAADELGTLVRGLCGAPTIGATPLSAMHSGWLNVKMAIAGKSDRAVLEACECGEDATKRIYQRILASDLPAVARLVIERQYLHVLKNGDQLKRLHDAQK